jgi:hypothetical protein
VPERSKFWLNIDFGGRGKIGSGVNFPKSHSTRQKLPDGEILAGWSRQIAPLFIKCPRENPAKPRKILDHAGTAESKQVLPAAAHCASAQKEKEAVLSRRLFP